MNAEEAQSVKGLLLQHDDGYRRIATIGAAAEGHLSKRVRTRRDGTGSIPSGLQVWTGRPNVEAVRSPLLRSASPIPQAKSSSLF